MCILAGKTLNNRAVTKEVFFARLRMQPYGHDVRPTVTDSSRLQKDVFSSDRIVLCTKLVKDCLLLVSQRDEIYPKGHKLGI